MLIEIARETNDGLARQVWSFDAQLHHGTIGLELALTKWEPQCRKSKRHKWVQSGEGYKRRSHNGVIHFGGYRMPAKDVPMPASIVHAAEQRLLASLKVIGPVDPPEDKRP